MIFQKILLRKEMLIATFVGGVKQVFNYDIESQDMPMLSARFAFFGYQGSG